MLQLTNCQVNSFKLGVYDQGLRFVPYKPFFSLQTFMASTLCHGDIATLINLVLSCVLYIIVGIRALTKCELSLKSPKTNSF